MKQMYSPAELSVLSVLLYFDIFDFPLTVLEIWKWAYAKGDGRKISLADVQNILDSEDLSGIIGSQEGFFYLKGKEGTVGRRLERRLIAERKFKKAIFFSKIFRYFPGVKMIAVCNTLAWSNASDESDIDLFIIAESGRIWSARFFTTALIKLLNKRPTAKNTRDMICLSFFIAEEALDLEKISLPQIKNSWPGDIYFTYWVAGLVPVYDDGIFKKFIEKNSWIKKYLPHSFAYDTNPRRRVKTASPFLKKIINILLANKFCDWLYKNYQLKVMPQRLRQLAAVGDTRVIINDRILKFHDKDRRLEFFNIFQEKINSIVHD